MMTEKEILETCELIGAPFPFLYDLPYNVADLEATAAYYEKQVSPDLWGSLRLLIDILARVEDEHQNPDYVRDHLENYFAAIHRLAPEQFLVEIEPCMDDPKLRLTLFTSISLNSSATSFEWLQPWLRRLDQLDDEEMTWLIEEIDYIARSIKRHEEGILLLQSIRAAVSPEHTEVHEKLDICSKSIREKAQT